MDLSLILADLGASVAQRINGQYSFLYAVISFVVTGWMLFDYYRNRKCRLLVIIATCLTLIHPIWTVNPIGGDLGTEQRTLSLIWTLIVFGLMFAMYFSKENWKVTRDVVPWDPEEKNAPQKTNSIDGNPDQPPNSE